MSYHTWDYEDGYHEPSQSQSDPFPAPSLPDLGTGGSSPPSSSSGGDGNSFLDLIVPAADWASNYIGPISQGITGGIDFYQNRANISDARDEIRGGYAQGRQDVLDAQQPYQQFGLEHMQGYNDLGEFDFDYQDNYLNSQNYNWLRDQGQQGLERSAAAGGQGLFSGQTLADISNYNQKFAQSQYQNEWDRQAKAYDTNRAYHQFGVGTGATAAQNVGDNLASMSIGRGQDMAALYAAQAGVNTAALDDLGRIMGGGAGSGGGSGSQGGGSQEAGSIVAQAAQDFVRSGSSTLLRNILGPGAANLSDDELNNIVGLIDRVPSLEELGGMFGTLWSQGGMGIGQGTDFLGSLGDWWDGDIAGTPGNILNNPDIFGYTPGAGLLSPEEFQAYDDPGFWDSVGNGISNLAGDAWDAFTGWADSFFP